MQEFLTSRKNSKVIALANILKHGSASSFIVEGFHCVEMAISSGYAKEIYSIKPYESFGVRNILVSPEVMDKISSSKTPEGVVALCQVKDNPSKKHDRVLVIDRVQDPGNIGTLLRTALAFGFDKVVTSYSTCSIFNQKAIQSSQGAIFYLNIEESKFDAKSLVLKLKEDHYFCIGTSLENAKPFESFTTEKDKIAIVLGNEGKGIQKEALEVTDVNLRIAIEGIDSLNVGVAGGIFMHRFAKLG